MFPAEWRGVSVRGEHPIRWWTSLCILPDRSWGKTPLICSESWEIQRGHVCVLHLKRPGCETRGHHIKVENKESWVSLMDIDFQSELVKEEDRCSVFPSICVYRSGADVHTHAIRWGVLMLSIDMYMFERWEHIVGIQLYNVIFYYIDRYFILEPVLMPIICMFNNRYAALIFIYCSTCFCLISFLYHNNKTKHF